MGSRLTRKKDTTLTEDKRTDFEKFLDWKRESTPLLQWYLDHVSLSDQELLDFAKSVQFTFTDDFLDRTLEVKYWLLLKTRNDLGDLRIKLFGESPTGLAFLKATESTLPDFPVTLILKPKARL